MRYIEYQEHRSHGTHEFPFELYNVTAKHPRYIMPYHWHKESEFIYVYSGEFPIVLGNTQHILKPGSCLYIPSGTLHGGFPVGCHYQCLVFNMNSLILKNNPLFKIMSDLESNHIQIKNHFTASLQPEICKCVTNMMQAMSDKKNGYEFQVLGQVYTLWGTIMEHHYYTENAAFSHPDQHKLQHYKMIIEFIKTHYSEDLTLDDLADCVHMNSRYFCRFFKELTHQSPMDYLNAYRIESACEQLIYTNKSITEIAFDCGFHNAGYFTKVFKKYKGVTPSQYLKSSC